MWHKKRDTPSPPKMGMSKIFWHPHLGNKCGKSVVFSFLRCCNNVIYSKRCHLSVCVCVGNVVRTRKLADSLNVRTQVDIRLFPENEMKKSWRVEEAKNQKFIFLPGLGNFNAAIILKRTLLHGSAPQRGVNKLSFPIGLDVTHTLD